MAKSVREGVKTGIIIFIIYVLFVLYLLFVSDRVEKLDQQAHEDLVQNSLINHS